MNPLIAEIQALKKENNAVILAHYYVDNEVKQVADLIGDSYYLAQAATEVAQQTIVLCGVSFMGESAKLLNPEKTVLLPDEAATCPMAEMADIAQIDAVRRQYEDLAVVCYVNSTALLKAYSDVCVTSSNALKIVQALPNKNIFFIPDENLGRYLAALLPEKNFIFGSGFCYVHAGITKEAVQKVKQAHPAAKVLAHPECRTEALALADYIGSTAGIIGYAAKSDTEEFIVLTEEGVLSDLRRNNPAKRFYVANQPLCRDMKKVTLQKIKQVLQTKDGAVSIDRSLQQNAGASLARMLALAK